MKNVILSILILVSLKTTHSQQLDSTPTMNLYGEVKHSKGQLTIDVFSANLFVEEGSDEKWFFLETIEESDVFSLHFNLEFMYLLVFRQENQRWKNVYVKASEPGKCKIMVNFKNEKQRVVYWSDEEDSYIQNVLDPSMRNE